MEGSFVTMKFMAQVSHIQPIHQLKRDVVYYVTAIVPSVPILLAAAL